MKKNFLSSRAINGRVAFKRNLEHRKGFKQMPDSNCQGCLEANDLNRGFTGSELEDLRVAILLQRLQTEIHVSRHQSCYGLKNKDAELKLLSI